MGAAKVRKGAIALMKEMAKQPEIQPGQVLDSEGNPLKRPRTEPPKIRSLSGFVTVALDDKITEVYEEEVNIAVLPTRWAFIERLLVAGLASFNQERMRQAQAQQLVKPAGAGDMAEIAARLKAAKPTQLTGGKIIV